MARSASPSDELGDELPADGAHLDDIGVEPGPESEALGAGELAAPGAPAGAGGFVDRETFRHAFGFAFRIGGALTGLHTLTGAPDRAEAGPASDAVYDIAVETPALHWLIQPQSIWLQRAVVIAAFAVPVATECAHELRARRAKPVQQTPDSPVSDPAPEAEASADPIAA